MKKRVIALSVAFLFALSFIALLPVSSDAQECRIVRIMEEKSATGVALRLEPDVVQVKKGTCIIWVNWVPKEEVRINFKEDGKKCMDSTTPSSDFKSAENCFLTDFLKLGMTSSLHFTETGAFNYEVEVPGERQSSAAGPLSVAFGEVKTKGKIVVEE